MEERIVVRSIEGCHPEPPHRFDALDHRRGPGDPPYDLFLAGTVFLDLVLTGLATPPSPGTEVMAEGMGSSPGGIANLAVAASRLGLRTSLAAAFAEDVYGDFCWHALHDHEGVDLSASAHYRGWHSPVTVSLAHARDRAMVTHAHPGPVSFDDMIGTPPGSRAVFVDLQEEPTRWVRAARAAGSMVFADLGWDTAEQWDPAVLERLGVVDCFLPNQVEAMAYTQATSPEDALDRLGKHVPIVVVTCGADGAIAVDQNTGERATAPALTVDALDPTGAGDVFAASFVLGTLAGWPLRDRLTFANLTAGLSVRQFGGSLSAPGWGDLAQWWEQTRAEDAELAEAYGFLDLLLRDVTDREILLRATATIGLRPAR